MRIRRSRVIRLVFVASIASAGTAMLRPAVQVEAVDVPAVSIDDPSVSEGDAGTTTLTFTLSLLVAAVGGEQVTVDTSDGTATSTSPDGDFAALASQVVTFDTGDMSATVDVTVNGDTAAEDDETFDVVLSAPSGLTISDATGVGTIVNDDIEVSIDPTLAIAEGASGNLVLDVSPASHPAFDVDVFLSDGTASFFDPDNDYERVTPSTVSILAGETAHNVPITTNQDADVEGDEFFTADVNPPFNQPASYTVRVKPGADMSTVTITDDDVPSVVSIGDATVSEGGGSNQVTISMTDPTGHVCTATATSTDGSASSPGDFTAVSSQQVALDNVASNSLPITVVDDPDSEPNESFTVAITLSSSPNCVLADGSATVLILANDGTSDVTAPTVSVAKANGQADPTATSPIVFDVTFSEPVIGFDATDVVLGTPPAGATLTASVTGSGDTYQISVAVSGATATGDVQVSIPPGAASDGVNDNTASNQASVSFLVDTIQPSVSIVKKTGQPDPTNTSPIEFTVTFSEEVMNFVTGDVTFGGSANPTTATVTQPDPLDPTTYEVAVTGMSGSGTVTASVGAAKAVDLAGNPNTAAPLPAAQVEFDNVEPTVTIEQAIGQLELASDTPIAFTVVFSESVSNFVNGDVTLGGSAGATTALVSGSGTTYTVSVSGMTQDGTVSATVAAGVASDAASNGNVASTSIDNTVTFDFDEGDVTPPLVTVDQAAAQVDPTTGSPILFTVVFSESVGDFTTGDVTLSGTSGATTAVVTGSGTTFTVSVSGFTTSGTVIATIPAGVAHDAANNPNDASTASDNSVTFNEPVIVVSTPGGNVTITVTNGGQLTSASSVAPQEPPPSGVTFPFGQLSFTASNTPGGLVTFVITLPSPVTTYYKLVSTAWLEFTFDGETGAQVSGNTITVTIRDNGRGDSDTTLGTVTDPGAPAVVAQVPPTTPPTTPTTTPPTTTTAPRVLPPAGATTRPFVSIAVLLIGAGVALLATRRRPTSSTNGPNATE